MTSIHEIVKAAHAGELETNVAISMIGAATELREDRESRRKAGSFYTANDVAEWLTARAINSYLLEKLDVSSRKVTKLATENSDLFRTLLSEAKRTPDGPFSVLRALTTLRVCDPTCGAGVFLLAAWRQLIKIQRGIDSVIERSNQLDNDIRTLPRVSVSQLYGIDIDPVSVAGCKANLALISGEEPTNIWEGDALHDVIPEAEIMLGNPPYKHLKKSEAPDSVSSVNARNTAAWITERAINAMPFAAQARAAFVLPISSACSHQWSEYRDVWHKNFTQVTTTHFDTVPQTLFPGVVQRITLLEGTKSRDGTEAAWSTSRYHRWRSSERKTLFSSIKNVHIPRYQPEQLIPKVGSELEFELISRLAAAPKAGRFFADTPSSNHLFYKRRWSYFLLFNDEIPPMWDSGKQQRKPSELQRIDLTDDLDATALIALYSSSLFWWWYSVFADNRNVNRRELREFPLPKLGNSTKTKLQTLGNELLVALKANSEVRVCNYRSVGKIYNTYYQQGYTRPQLDAIDRELATLYAMTDTQLEFIIGYEHRFRSAP